MSQAVTAREGKTRAAVAILGTVAALATTCYIVKQMKKRQTRQ